MTRPILRAMTLAAILIAVDGLAHAQNAACQSVQFSAEVLERFPRARASCLDVIQRGGEQYAVFKAQLLEVHGNNVRIRVKSPDGTLGPAATLVTKKDRKVLIDGKPYAVSELAPDQEITAYVRVDEPAIALAPVTDTEPVESVPLPPQETGPVRLSSAAEPSMPETASSLGLLAVFGSFLLAVAAVFTMARKHGRRIP